MPQKVIKITEIPRQNKRKRREQKRRVVRSEIMHEKRKITGRSEAVESPEITHRDSEVNARESY